VEMSAYALMAYALGLIGFSLVKVLAPGYFARQDTKTPVKVGMISLCANMAFNIAVVVPVYKAGFFAPHALLALSTGMSACLNSSLLYRGLRRGGIYAPSSQWRRLWPQAIAANLALGLFLWFAAGDWAAWNHYPPLVRIARLGLCVGGGGVVYFAVLWLTGMRYRDLKVAAPP
jgi:putative peptidoglycan lipid II flippase